MPDTAKLAAIEMSTDLLLVSVDAMTKDQVAGPSLLPGWSRGQLLIHIAGGPGSGAHLAAVPTAVADLSADLARSAETFAAEVAALPADEADARLAVRLREVEIHHVDLAAGYSFADVPPEVADAVIDEIVQTQNLRGGGISARVTTTDSDGNWQLGAGGATVSGTQADVLGWLSGRAGVAGLTVSDGGPVPAAPVWI